MSYKKTWSKIKYGKQRTLYNTSFLHPYALNRTKPWHRQMKKEYMHNVGIGLKNYARKRWK